MSQNGDSEVWNEPLVKSERSLRVLHDVIRTCYGPNGRLKALDHAEGGCLTLTSSSSVLFQRISPSNPFIRLIFGAVKGHLANYKDCGLLTSLTVTSFVLSSLSLDLSKRLMADLIEHIAQECLSCLNCLKLKIQLETTSHLLATVKTVIGSKPACILTESEKSYLSVLILKAFLNVVPDSGVRQMGTVEVVTQNGLNPLHSKVFCGVLIACQSSAESICDKLSKEKLKLLLFTTSLAGDTEFSVKKIQVNKNVSIWDEVLCHLKNLCDGIINSKTDIVVCQKVIHPIVRNWLEKAGILVCDRLGADVAKAVKNLTSASPIQSIFLREDFVGFGYVDKVEIVKIDQKSYLNFQCNSRTWTVLVCHTTNIALSETVVVCKQAIDALYRLTVNHHMLFGAGCTETSLAAFIHKKVNHEVTEISKQFRCTESKVIIILDNFISVLHDLAVSVHQSKKHDFMTDNTYHHLWKLTEERCMCGQFLRNELADANWTCLSVQKYDNKKEITETVSEVRDDAFLDEFTNKYHAFSTAFEIISLLFKTGICIIEKT